MKSFKSFCNEDFLLENEKLRLSKKVYSELMATEGDTLDPDSPKDKHALVSSLTDAKKKGQGYEIDLSPAMKKYLLKSALPNMIDIMQDQGNRRLVTSFQKLKKQIAEEVAANNTSQVPGAGDDSSTVVVRRKYKKRPLTRNFIEVNGKRKKRSLNR